MAKVLSLTEVRSRLQRFVADWREAEGYERGEAQQFVRDLLACFGLTQRTAALYERRASRLSTGGRGYIDALIPGKLLIEMKGAGRDLEKAEDQATDYLDSLSHLELPRYILTSNFKTFRFTDLEAITPADTTVPAPEQVPAPSPAGTVVFQLEELPLHAELLGFLAGHQTRTFGQAQQEQASVDAARIMGGLYEEVAKAGLTDHEASIFLFRTLFALYADDAGLWRHDLFLEFLEEHTSDDGSDLGAQLSALYQLLNQPEDRRPQTLDDLLSQFPYVNGGVFGESVTIPMFGRVMRDKLIACCAFNWEAISPAVFGSLFQAVKDSKVRRQLGEHYTTESNILKVLEPLFLDELRERFRMASRDAVKLRRLLRDLGKIRVLETFQADWIQIGGTCVLAA